MATEQDRGKAGEVQGEVKTTGEAFASPVLVIRSLRSLRWLRSHSQQICLLRVIHPRR